VPVDDHLRVLKQRPGIEEIVLDAGAAGDADATVDPEPSGSPRLHHRPDRGPLPGGLGAFQTRSWCRQSAVTNPIGRAAWDPGSVAGPFRPV
jgi:hypothetical protein